VIFEEKPVAAVILDIRVGECSYQLFWWVQVVHSIRS